MSTTTKPIKNFADVWENLNTMDADSNDDLMDIGRVRVRVQINRQRIDLIKLAYAAGTLKPAELSIT